MKRAWILGAVMFVACGKSAAPPVQQPVASSGTAKPVKLTPADVTIIWPMPADEQQRETMIGSTAVGGHGELYPAAFHQAPLLDQRDFAVKDPHVDHARLVVVSARLDPCFASFAQPQDPTCINQVRLVLQGIRPGGGTVKDSGSLGANDGAVHLFYKVPREELLALARELADLRDNHGGPGDDATLGVHPILAREGLGSGYANSLQAALLQHVGVKRLTRVTFFARTAAREPLWPFGIFEVIDGKPQKQAIMTIGKDRQELEGAGFRKVVMPPTSSADNPGALIAITPPARAASDAEKTAFGAVLRIQNPTKHTPETMACAECHASQRMQSAGEKLLGLRATDFAADYFVSNVKPTPDSKIDAENFHAAGYLGTNLAVSTRTANETAVVVAAMNGLLGN